ncbi:ABC transporter ATP-binding protein [Prevotella sp. KH2C16]|uniref:ABC transporter ATP-binding protein n=1 Tax=Prevotella sp. KH2C16 TaxID=1855325 RepID=UPI0008E04EAB|nr:ABC transporter ATP-binding protein [Prevotella sp. KH2C16]SFG60449.1 ATP-binding cassette, subfamily B [Prevotella sp. KH2C16]
MLRTLIRQVGQYRTASLLTPLFTALEVVMDVLIPYVTAWLIDRGINAGDMRNVYLYGIMMIGMAFLSLLFGILAGRYAAYASSGFACNLRDAMYRNIQTFAFSNIDRFSTSGLVTRMTTDVSNLQNAFQQILRVSVRAPFRLVLSVIMCLVINPGMSLIFLVALVVLAMALGCIVSRVGRLFGQVFQQYDVLNNSVQENISAIRLIKAFVREDYEVLKFSKAAQGLYRLFVRAEANMALMSPVMNMVVYGCIIALSWFGAHFVVGGSLTMGELTSLFTYVMSILMSLMMLSHIFVMLTMSEASGRRVAEVIDERPDIVNPPAAIARRPGGDVEFFRVDFSYHDGSGEYVLQDINFRVRAGETIGIIGGTGSGKSTLVSLIDRLYDVTQGGVLVGGRDVRTYDLKTLRDAVAVVLQQNVLFSGTILDNLRWGNPAATLEDCRRACRLACADEFIERMPEGYDTRIEQGGVNVSGGQRQRLCIARALLRNPSILILDDSTSACDTATDARIQKAFREEMPEVTKFIIAQRVSSVQECDRIMVMDHGRITGFDTHRRLLETNQLYREIFDIQTDDDGDFDNWEDWK